MESLVIKPLTTAIRKAHKLGKARKEAQDAETKARKKVEALMTDNAAEIRGETGGGPQSDLVYRTADNIEARVVHGKDKLSVKRKEVTADDDPEETGGATILDPPEE